MKFFWPLYLSSVVVGTAGVYVAAPLARPYVAGLLGKGEAAETAPATAPALVVKPSPAAAPAVRAPLPPAAKTAAPQPEEDEESPPALHGVYMASHGDRPGWGITNQRTTYYKLDGRRMGNLPGGVLFDCQKSHQSSKGLMIECVFLESAATNTSFLVSRKDIFLFTGSHTNLSARQVKALKDYYQLSGKIGMRKSELLQASASKNPHFTAANTAYRAFTEHTEKAKALSLKRDSATELDKARLEDQLREMKVAETRFRNELTAANQKFRQWKEQHAEEVAKPESDPDIKKWTQEMDELRRLVPGLAL
jgi:hypothetical protein